MERFGASAEVRRAAAKKRQGEIMFNLSDIIQASQGGQGVNNLARQFGLRPEQAQAAVDALIPGLSAGLQQQAGSLAGLGGIINSLNQGWHQQAYSAPQAAPPPGSADASNQALNQIFGNSQILAQILQQAAAVSGVNVAILQQMLPILVSMVLGGMFHSMNNQGLGGILSQLANAVSQGNLGSILGPVAGGAAPTTAPAAGSILGTILGGLFGGGGAAAPAPSPTIPTGQPAAMQAGLEALTKMMQPGIQIAQAHQQMLQNIFSQATRMGRTDNKS
jgi:hypothetical protein